MNKKIIQCICSAKCLAKQLLAQVGLEMYISCGIALYKVKEKSRIHGHEMNNLTISKLVKKIDPAINE